MIKNKKRGFTIVEVLATILILSIIMLIAGVSVTKLVQKSRNNYYFSLEGNIKTAGIDYFTEHKKELPKYRGQTVIVEANTLVNKGYLDDDVKDHKGNNITNNINNDKEKNESYVIAYKVDKQTYNYYSCINNQYYNTYEDRNIIYCNEAYKEGDEFIMPPNNRVIGLPDTEKDWNDNKNNFSVPILSAQIYSNINNELITKGTKILPIRVEIVREGKIKETYNNDFGNQVTNYIKNELNTGDYLTKLNSLLNDKTKICIYYEYLISSDDNYKKEVQVIYSINKNTLNKGNYRLSVDLKINNSDIQTNPSNNRYIGASKLSSIETNNNKVNDLDWTTKPVDVYFKSTKGIVIYICKDLSNPTEEFDCTPESFKTISINEVEGTRKEMNKASVVEVYGITDFGFSTNTVQYVIKSDTLTPSVSLTAKVKNNSTDLNASSNISALKNYQDNKWLNGYVFTKAGTSNYGPSGSRITCTDDRPSKDNFSSYRNVNTQGTTTITCKATSGAGKESSTTTKIIKLDRTPPTIPTSKVNDATKTSYNPNKSQENKTLIWNNFSATDSYSGLRSIKISENCDDSKFTTVNSSYTFKNTEKSYCIKAVDNVGLESATSIYNFLTYFNLTINQYCDDGVANSGYTSPRTTTVSYKNAAAINLNDVNTICNRTGYHSSNNDSAWRINSKTSSSYASQTSFNGKSYIEAGNYTINLYPNWVANTYTLTYNPVHNCSSSSKLGTYDQAWGTLCTPTRTGYTFGGWYTTANGGGTHITSNTTVGGNIIVYPKWIANTYNISYDSNGGTGSMSNTGCTYDSDCTLRSNSFTKTGHSFAGWATSSGGSKVYNNNATVKNLATSGTATLYASWNANQYKLTYNSQSGSSCSSKTGTYGSKWGNLCTPTRTGYTFGGWYTSTNGGGTHITKDTTVDGNKTVYAKWTLTSFKLCYKYVNSSTIDWKVSGVGITAATKMHVSSDSDGTYKNIGNGNFSNAWTTMNAGYGNKVYTVSNGDKCSNHYSGAINSSGFECRSTYKYTRLVMCANSSNGLACARWSDITDSSKTGYQCKSVDPK